MENTENIEEIQKVEEVVEKKPKTTSKSKKAKKEIKITLIRSACSSRPNQRKTCDALGLRKLNASKVVEDTPAIRGMIFTIKHLVKVEEI